VKGIGETVPEVGSGVEDGDTGRWRAEEGPSRSSGGGIEESLGTGWSTSVSKMGLRQGECEVIAGAGAGATGGFWRAVPQE
jgi:hypothetical protein